MPHTHIDLTQPGSLDDALVTQGHLLDIRRVRHRGNHDIATGGHFLAGLSPSCPAPIIPWVASGMISLATTSWLASNKCPAMRRPIIPKPMNPIFCFLAGFLSLNIWLHHPPGRCGDLYRVARTACSAIRSSSCSCCRVRGWGWCAARSSRAT